jgi:dihydroorotate dehydrogenase electron transfer subunit
MKIAYARVVSSERLYGQTHLLWLSAPEISRGAAPGQFLMLRCCDPAPWGGEGNVAATFRSPLAGPHERSGELKLSSTSSRHGGGRGGLKPSSTDISDPAPGSGEGNVAATFRSPLAGPYERSGELKLSSTAIGHTGVSYGPPMFPRPMSYHRLRKGENGLEFSVLFDAIGRGTEWLACRRTGDPIFAYGPLGRGYSVRRAAQNLLLVAGGIGVAPLVWLAEEAVAAGKSVTLLIGAATADGVFPAHLLPPEVEVIVTTEDGSLGRRGLVTEPFAEHLSWADQVFACGPNAMFRALADVVRACEGAGVRRGRKPVQVLLEEVMPCGTGICYGCAVMTRRGVKLVCKDGPRFELREVF